MFSHEEQGPAARAALPAKMAFRMEGQLKSFPDKEKLKEFTITEPLPHEMFKGLI